MDCERANSKARHVLADTIDVHQDEQHARLVQRSIFSNASEVCINADRWCCARVEARQI